MTKVLAVTEAMGGGVYRWLANTYNVLAARGMEVHVVYTRRNDTPPLEVIRADFHPSIRLLESSGQASLPVRAARLSRDIWRLSRELRPDVVHLHSSIAGFVGRILPYFRHNHDVQVLYTPHGYSFLRLDIPVGFRYVFRWLEGLLGRAVGHTLACSASEASVARGMVGAGSVRLVQNGIPDMSAGVPTTPPGDRETAVRVVSVGRLAFQKDPDFFVSVVKEVASQVGLEVKFTWIGDGPLRSAIESRIERENLSDQVHITGWLPQGQTLQRVRAADIYVQTSLWEGMPLSVLEAMALGRPLVVRNTIGNKDCVQPDQNGFIESTVGGFADRIVALARDATLRAKIGANGRGLYLEEYTLEKMVNTLITEYSGSEKEQAV